MNTRQFSSTFLDFWRNSRGYVDEVRTADRDAAKRLLSPFILKDNNNSSSKCFSECHPLGNAMWNFAKQCTTVHSQPNSQSTDANLAASCWKFKKDDKSGHDGVGNGDDDNDDDDDDDDDVGPDYDFQSTHCNADDRSHSSLLSAPCSTSNVPLSSACKTTELVKRHYFKPHTGALQSDFTGSERLSEATNISTSENSNQIQNQDTVIGSNKFSKLRNREQLLHCDEEPTSKAGVDWKTAYATTPGYNGTSNLHDDIYSGNYNSGNSATQNVNHGHSVALVIASEETELSSNSSQPRKGEDSAVTIKSLGSNLLVGNKTCNNKKDMFSEEISAAYMSTRSDVMRGDDDLLDNSPYDDMENSNELHDKKVQIKPLPFYKCVGINRKNISTTMTLNLKLKALQSVLHTEAKILRNVVYEDVDVCGKVAILHGFQEEESLSISVVESEVVGLYDYIAGTVQPLKQGSHPDDLGCQVCYNIIAYSSRPVKSQEANKA